MPTKVDLTGRRFGRLVALSPLPPVKAGGSTRWLCSCDCGNKSTPGTAQLIRGRAQSCGCLQRDTARSVNTKHGEAGTPEYRAWRSMLARCTIKSNGAFSNYGGRGISVCKRWMDFKAFKADMGPPPPGTTIDRINNNGNYEPSNCRWATKEDQDSNKRTTVLVTFNGKTMTYAQWGRELNADQSVLRRRWIKFGTLNPIQRTAESYRAKENRAS